MVFARSTFLKAWVLISATVVSCAVADQRTEELAKSWKDPLSALDNADLSDLLENDLDETFLFRHRAHMALNKDNKVKNMNKQMDRILQQEENDDEEDFSAPPSSMSPTPASTSRGDIFSNAPTASPTFTGRGIVDLPSSSPTASPTSIDGDGGISRDASAAWRQTGAGLVGAVGAAAAVAVAVAVATAGLTMTGVVF